MKACLKNVNRKASKSKTTTEYKVFLFVLLYVYDAYLIDSFLIHHDFLNHVHLLFHVLQIVSHSGIIAGLVTTRRPFPFHGQFSLFLFRVCLWNAYGNLYSSIDRC